MASELFNSLNNACRAGGHIVYREGANGEEGRFERAGKRHAIATFFGSASAKELNRTTLNKAKEVLSAERTTDSSGALSGETFSRNYFTDDRSLKIGSSGDRRVESSAIRKIIADIRNDVSAAIVSNLTRSFGYQFEGFDPPKGSSVSRPEYCRNVFNGLAAVFSDVNSEDADDFVSVMADMLRHNAGIGASFESVEASARTVNGALQVLRARTGIHPDALKDGIQLMKDLHAPIDAWIMEGLLDLVERTADGLLCTESFAESLDRNLSAICFAGNGVQSPLDKDEKNWIVAKFILSSVPKVHYEEGVDHSGRKVFAQHVCGDMILSSFGRNLQAFYARIGGALCTRYAQALEFLADRYWESGLYVKFRFDEVDALLVPNVLKEKYEIRSRTAVKSGNYRTSPGDYGEFAGLQEYANTASAWIDGVLKRSRILDGDKVRVKQLTMQHIAFVCKDSGESVAKEDVVGITSLFCRMAKWGGALLDRLEKEVPVSHRRAVVLSLEAYNCSSDAVLFDMLTKDKGIINEVKAYVDTCIDDDWGGRTPEGNSIDVRVLHQMLTGKIGDKTDLDPGQNPHLATVYSR